jgi:hypothetical protein
MKGEEARKAPRIVAIGAQSVRARPPLMGKSG